MRRLALGPLELGSPLRSRTLTLRFSQEGERVSFLTIVAVLLVIVLTGSMHGVFVKAEIVSTTLQTDPPRPPGTVDTGSDTLWVRLRLGDELQSTRVARLRGDVNVDLMMQFNPDDYGPTLGTFDHVTVTDGSWALSDLHFGIDLGSEMFDPTLYVVTEGIGGQLLGSSPVRTGSTLYPTPPPPPPVTGYFPAANLGIVIDTGGYVEYDSTFDWFTVRHFEDGPLPASMTSGTGRVRVELASVEDGVATYDVTARLPVNFTIPVELFTWLDVFGWANAWGTFTRTVGVAEPSLVNGNYEDGLAGWTAAGGGTAAPLDWDGNGVVRLTTSSPAMLGQAIDTPDHEFILRFDYLFEQELGTLDVSLGGQSIATIASEGITGQFRTSSTLIDDPNLFGLSEADLQFTFDGPEGGLQLLLDNIGAPVPVFDSVGPPGWKPTGDGSYNDAANWVYGIVPNEVGAEAQFLGSITGASEVTVDSAVTVGTMTFDNAHSYSVVGPAGITLEASHDNAQINVQQGDHTISAPLTLAGGLTVATETGSSLTVNLEDLAVVTSNLTKEGPGAWVLNNGLAVLGAVNVRGGTLEIGTDLLANPGGNVNISDGATLKAGGVVNRRVLGGPGAVLEATADGTAIGLFSSTDGYNFQGKLEVGPYMVGLMDADKAQVYETHLGGGSLSSFNGIGLQAVDVFGTLGTHQGWLTGHGTVKGAVRFEVEGANFAAIAGDGPGQEIVLDGVVSGSGWLEWVIMTGLHRPGASAGFTGLGQGTNIGPGATVMGIDGPAGFETPNPSENAARGYDQWFAMFGQHAISGDLTIALEEGFVPSPSDRFEIFQSWDPTAGLGRAGWYVHWFDSVTLDPAWPNPEAWGWEFQYLEGGMDQGDAPDPGREFYSATLMVIPEPGTPLLLATAGLGLLLVRLRRKR